MKPQEEGLRLALEYLAAEPEYIWVYEDDSLPVWTTEEDLDMIHRWMKHYVTQARTLLNEVFDG